MQVLLQARKVKLAEYGGASGGVSMKVAATGARILELPGAEGPSNADRLAAKLREAIDPELAEVYRPVKCAELRLTGLDDTATSEDVRQAIASAGECSADSVKSSEPRRSGMGLWTATAKCPIDAAKKIVDEGKKIFVGWVSAGVKLLPPRAQRCFKCLAVGHVREACQSDIDRSNLCFRCGQPGHQVRTCTATPFCILCTEAKRKADHVLGGTNCKAPRPSKRAKKKNTAPPTQEAPAGGEAMEAEASSAAPG